jgi:hypothetical protein
MSFVHLFTEAEQLAAYRLVLSEEDARGMAAGADATNASLRQPGGTNGISYSEATLVLLSMVSPETAAKVEALRRRRCVGDEARWAEDERRWNEAKHLMMEQIRLGAKMKGDVPDGSS